MLAAVENGDAKKFAELIRRDPGFKVNLDQDGLGNTLFHFACGGRDNRSDVISLLLAHPDIYINVKDIGGNTPFYLACLNGHTSCVREMLRDSRVKVSEHRLNGFTPLLVAANNGRLNIIKWWIASGREMDLGNKWDAHTDAIGAAKKQGKTEEVTLLKRFKKDAAKTRNEVRFELGINGQDAGLPFSGFHWN